MSKTGLLRCAVPLVALALCSVGPMSGQTEADREAIIATALNYIEGWYEADADRMERALHPALAKRIAMPGSDGKRSLDHMTAETLVQYTARNQSQGDVDLRDKVRILDVYGHAAVVRVDADDWVDFLQIAKLDEGWLIVNVLWELRSSVESQ